MDDDLYSDIFDIERIEQAVAASIKAIFVLLGKSDLLSRQDPISFDKMVDTMVLHCNVILRQYIDTRKMTVKILMNTWPAPSPFCTVDGTGIGRHSTSMRSKPSQADYVTSVTPHLD